MCAWLWGERQDTCLRSSLREWARDCARVWFWWETLWEFVFFFFFLPLLLFLVTIARDRSRGVRNKIIWHIFFQLLDTLPVCQDFNRQVCNRPACKFIHLSDGEFSWSAATRRDALIPLSDGNIFFPHVPFFFSLLSPLNISFRRTFHWFSFYSLLFIFDDF